MKQIIKNYSLNVSNKTVTLTDYSTIVQERLQLIVDTTTNTILYNFADSTVSQATISGNVVTLSVIPASSANTDKLQIVYDAAIGDPTYDDIAKDGADITASNMPAGGRGVRGWLSAMYNKLPVLGQTTIANSQSVTVASDQPPITIQNESITYKDDFPGTTLDTSATGWTVRQANGSATTYSVSGSALTITSGTTANDYIAFTSKQVFTTPMRMQVQFQVSAKTTNTNFYVELVNASGTAVANLGSLGVTSGTTQVAWYMPGSSAAGQALVVAQNQGVKATGDSSTGTGSYVGAYTMLEIEARGDIVDYAYRTPETNATSQGTVSRTRTITTPGESYYLQIRSVNGSTAPASSVTMTVESILMQDVTKTVTEISGGRGNSSVTKALPVYTTNASTPGLNAGGNVIGGVFMSASTNQVGLTPYNNVSVTNTLILVKSSLARLHEVIIDNPNTSKVYLQCFNASSTGAVTLGTTAPTAWYPVSASGIFEDFFPVSRNYSSGLVIAVTTTPNGSTAPSSAVPLTLAYI